MAAGTASVTISRTNPLILRVYGATLRAIPGF